MALTDDQVKKLTPISSSFIEKYTELLPEVRATWSRQIAEVCDEVLMLRNALRSIEHDAKLNADPARAHSGQVSYNELLDGYAEIAAAAKRALDGEMALDS